jgi:hypothetical protein
MAVIAGKTVLIRRLITAVFCSSLLLTAHMSHATQVDILGPPGSVGFGAQVAVLPNGNIVITDPRDPSGGAAYLYNPNRVLISKVTGVNPGALSYSELDSVKIVVLKNGNYLLTNRYWSNSVQRVGMVAWANGNTGINGVISKANALIGSTSGDQVGYGITLLANGNYVVGSHYWTNGSATMAGAATWGNGTKGVAGVVSSANSLVGTKQNENVGWVIQALTNGNYVVNNQGWSNAPAGQYGAVTWGNGASGTKGIISIANSMVGSHPEDTIYTSIVALSNGNYVSVRPNAYNGAIANAGAVTWGNGTTGTFGVISSSNSLVGTKDGNYVGYSGNDAGVVALTNGNYVVTSSDWEGDTGNDVGAVTWANGSTGLVGAVSPSNSLIGDQDYEYVGDDLMYSLAGVVALTNGNYVVLTPRWDAGTKTDVGAVTWANGATGLVGVVSSSNSLTGSTAGDLVGCCSDRIGVTALANGNYVVSSSSWHNGAGKNVGATTWANGNASRAGVVSAANSLIGSSADDGAISVTALANGHYVVGTSGWDRGAVINAGAVTWGNGNVGRTGTISPATSLVGSSAADFVGFSVPLADGNYVVCSSSWNAGAKNAVGAVTWADGKAGAVGEISSSNSLVGTTALDNLCFGELDSGVTALVDGRYLIYSPGWDNGSNIPDAEAVTLGIGSLSGSIGPGNSVMGTVPFGGDGSGGHQGLFFSYDQARQRVVVGQPSSNRVTLLTLLNDNGPTLSISDVTIDEGNSGTRTATFTVKLSQPAAVPVTYDIATASGTATAGSDYMASRLNGQIISAGATSKTFAVIVNGDTAAEGNEIFTVNVSNVIGAKTIDAQAVSTIRNDDGVTTGLTSPARNDFNGDGLSDILWRNSSTGANTIWRSARSATSQSMAGVTDLAWKIVGVGDFDGDGKDDVLWRNSSTGANTIWRSASSATTQAMTGVTNLAWKIAGVGDFDGDGKDDVLWRNSSTGANTIWRSASSATPQAMTGVTNLAWKIAGVGDFNGDGRDDVLWRFSSTGANTIWQSASSAAPQAMTGVTDLAWNIAGVGDFDGDFKDDVLWRNSSTGANVIWKSANSATPQSMTGVTNLTWHIVGTGDYNGDGKADVLWRNFSTGANTLWKSANAFTLQTVATVTNLAWVASP